MKIKAAKHKKALHYDGVEYKADKDGYCDVPETVAYRAGWAKKPEKAKAEIPPEKAELVEKALELGIGNRSTLERWGIERLKSEISDAETEGDSGDDHEDDEEDNDNNPNEDNADAHSANEDGEGDSGDENG